MVKKLFKHEFLAWLRILPLIYGITLAIATMHRVLQVFENDSVYYNVVFVSATIMYAVAVLTCIAAPVVFGIQRFYKNLFTGEGYLTHTLPVTPANHLWVKSLTAAAFSVLSFLICLISGMIICAGDLLSEIWKAGAYLVNLIPAEYTMDLVFTDLEAVVLLLVTTIANHFLYYTCICAGQLFRKNRVLAAVGVYFGLYMLTQFLGTVLGVVMVILTESGVFDVILDWTARYPIETVHIVLCGSIVLYSVLTLVYFLFCHFVLKKKLNLE